MLSMQYLDHDWVTREQAAAYLQLTTRSIDRYIASGRIKATQLVPGGTVRISTISIEKMLESARL